MTAGRHIISKSQSWGTPQKYVDAVKLFFNGVIALDPCSNEFSIVHAEMEYMLPEKNGLLESWDFSTIYVNPPYGFDPASKTSIKDWLSKCADANARYSSEVLALIPVATNTRHWKNFIFKRASMICFLYDTRLRFLEEGKDVGKGAPMACAMVYWGERLDVFKRIFSEYGFVIDISKDRDLNVEVQPFQPVLL